MNNVLVFIGLLLGLLLMSCSQSASPSTPVKSDLRESLKYDYAMVIHGGAGFSNPDSFTDEKTRKYTSVLTQALEIGESILKNGGTSEEAVVEVISHLEDSPLFNAGKGAVFTHDGQNELDASIMNGEDRNAGAVAAIRKVKNPIKAARAVMNHSDHVLLTSDGADQFAVNQGLESVDTSYYFTQKNWDRLQGILSKEKETGLVDEQYPDWKFGTVGAVALDKSGNITAGTSTGGMTNKKYDRVGDSPLIGSGTYADNQTCGVSCTGHGEYFIRYGVASDVTHRMAYLGESVEESAATVIANLKSIGGNGGLIALDKNGHAAMPFNTTAMFRGYIAPDTVMVRLF